MRGLRRNYRVLIVPTILIVLTAWLWGPTVGFIAGILFTGGLFAGLSWR